MINLLNKLEEKLRILYSQKRFRLFIFTFIVVLIAVGVLLDRGFKTRESPTELTPRVGIEQKKDCVPTSQDVQGPYFRPNAPARTSIAPPDTKGEKLFISGIIYHSDCKTPITQLASRMPLIEVWHADNTGEYDNTTSNYWYRGTIPVDSQGHYQFETMRPGNYLDGGGFRPAHIHFKVTAPGYRPLTTQIYFKDDPYLGSKDSCAPCNSEDSTLVIELIKALDDDIVAGSPREWLGTFNIVLEPTEPQTVDTSDWQTYRSEEFGFELRIPKEWKPFQERQRDNRVLSLILNEIPNQPFGDNLLFWLSVEVANDQEDISEWFRRKEFSGTNMKEFFDIANETYGEGFVSMADFSILIEDTQIDGLPAKVQTIRCLKKDCYFMGGPQDRKEYYVKRNGMVFTTTVITSDPNMYFTLLDQILSTFRFVE